ncbi:MAG: sigma-54-dependent Fis family transcriptional regulator, partial [Planctomycetes bacterium]|nr:sigma-54-dependent Fis family transcriptional regulator [Planctomycetota bacterium]
MPSARVLVVDDEVGMLEACADILRRVPGLEVVPEQDPYRAAGRLSSERWDLLIADVRMPGLDGIELLRVARQHDEGLPVLMLTAFPNVETAVESLKLGAADYITKPFLPEDLLANVRRLLDERRLRQENRLLERQVERAFASDELVGACPAMQAVFESIQRAAETDVDVLITGETGVGKELVARSVHKASRRRGGRFVPVDCGAIPENLLESEFFGHERGSFTGAHAQSLGLLEFADGGTFFLDEVCELPLALQAKLLRALQEKRIRRVGAVELRSVDVRVVAATNRDMAGEVKAGRFREDLFYRLDVINIRLPSLRERLEDIPLFVRYYLPRIAREMGRPATVLGDAAMD